MRRKGWEKKGWEGVFVIEYPSLCAKKKPNSKRLTAELQNAVCIYSEVFIEPVCEI